MRTTSGHFIFKGEFAVELKKHQPSMSLDGQIANLRELGLIIDDEKSAVHFLNDVSYYRFIKAYSLGLKPKNGVYSDGVTFELLKDLYIFNCNFRQLIFPLIERIEVNLRCRVSNYFCEKYGVLGYLNYDNFSIKEYHDEFLCDADAELYRNAKAPFVKNFSQNYEGGKLPFYALVELLSFGTLSKFYKNMKNEDKKAVAKTYGVGYTYFESWIESCAFVRNVCAHYGRLYNVNLAKPPMMYKQYEGIDNFKIFALLLCFKYLVPDDLHWAQFVETLELLIERYSDVKINLMGFPENWVEMLK